MNPTTEQMRGYLLNTPSKPNPQVGTRYRTSEPRGLAEKTPVDLEQHKGASVMVMPWDSTSRNVDVHSVSGHDLPEPVTTHGGQDYARDKKHMARGIAGASGMDIAKRISTREQLARMENEQQGGTGRILHMPITMGDRAEDFSMTPTQILYQLIKRAEVPQDMVDAMNNAIRAHKITKAGKVIQPFGGFVGIDSPKFNRQIEKGQGLDTTPGELRKAIVDRIGYLKEHQKALDFNMEDVVGAVTDPALRGVPKGYVGNTVIGSDPDQMSLTPSKNKAYDTNFSGEYLGSLGHSFPAEVLFGQHMARLQKEFADRPGDKRTMALGALEKRKQGVAQILDNQTLDSYGQHMLNRAKLARQGHYANGGEVSQDEMLAHVMLHRANGGAVQPDEPDGTSTDTGYYEGGPSDNDGTDPLQYRAEGGTITSIGIEEAPNMNVKRYVPPGPGGMPVGGVDFQPEQTGQQFLPAQQAPPGAPQGGPPPGGPPPGGPPPGAPQGGPPPGALGQPPSNILQMTRPGQLMGAMQPPQPMPPGMLQMPPGMPRMAKGGSTTPTVEEMRRAIQSAAKSAGMKAPVVATRNLTDLQDFHTSLGDRVRQGAADMQDLVESMPFKYDKGHRVFTADSAKKNKPPYTIMYRKPYGNQPMREEGSFKTIKDPQTGKAMRTPYEPGYKVRHEQDGDWSEFDIPESAIKGRVAMARGGRIEDIKLTERKL